MTRRVAVFGAGGRMGSTVCRAVWDDPAFELVAVVDPHHSGIDLRQLCKIDSELQIAYDATALLGEGVEVAVDFTEIGAARQNARWCAENGVHFVAGTSGFTEEDFEELGKLFVDSNCVIVPNFAIGAVLMMRFAELAAPWFDTAEVIELHHDEKIDSPSGTAIATAQRMAAASAEWAPDPTRRENLAGARGAEGAGGIRIHSVRLRGVYAHQEVVLGTTGQSLTIRHDTFDRSSFMPGVVLALKQVAERPGLTVGLDALLGL